MNNDKDKIKDGEVNIEDTTVNGIPDFLVYPPEEDIYNQLKKEEDINPENISKNKVFLELNDVIGNNEKDFGDTMTGSDLDVPGSELDDQDEKIGSEDEENNYYSLGGDNHDN
ncbi:hypothetical protein RCH18_003109 [Flavobacterium sp. PL11]|jgi:hypothetical protein|uniref:hypothetical protein n=1 Tax=Flavobacterium sp. PL11 TaxID=3071717 RepID=UPI002E021ECF|nr:hypothetical protein [Flavobacterium sp. PL11]